MFHVSMTTRWAPTRYKWSYDFYKYRVITPFTPLFSAIKNGGPFHPMFFHDRRKGPTERRTPKSQTENVFIINIITSDHITLTAPSKLFVLTLIGFWFLGLKGPWSIMAMIGIVANWTMVIVYKSPKSGQVYL